MPRHLRDLEIEELPTAPKRVGFGILSEPEVIIEEGTTK